MAAGPESKHPASPLLARWRETARGSGAPPAVSWIRAPAPSPLPEEPTQDPVDVAGVQRGAPVDVAVPPDPAALLAEIEGAIAAAAPGSPAVAEVARAALDPIRAALAAPEAERDPAALLLAFEQAEDILEALLLSARAARAP